MRLGNYLDARRVQARRPGRGAAAGDVPPEEHDREHRHADQPRAVLARVQPARARRGPGRAVPAPRARQVPRHLQLQPRRVLHDPGRRAQAPAPRRRPRRRGRTGSRPPRPCSRVAERTHELVAQQHRCFLEDSSPGSPPRASAILRPKDVDAAQQRFLEEYFRRTLLPVLTPLAIDPGHPFPYLANRSLCLVAALRPAATRRCPTPSLAVVHLPSHLVPRFVALPAPAGPVTPSCCWRT